MGYLAAYNTSSFSGSLDRGNINIAISSSIVSGSTETIRFGDTPTPPSGGMVIVSDSNVQLGIASASATPQFWIINNLADTASVLNTINALPERVNQTRFTTTSSAYLYLVSSSKYFPILGTEPLNTVVTSNLITYLDPSQLVSYPTTASVWYDISGRNKNFNIFNNPSYIYPYFIMDGVDDYFSAQSSSATFPQSAFTAEWLVNTTNGTSGILFWVEELQLTLFTNSVNRRWYNNTTASIQNAENFGVDYGNKWIHLVWQVGTLTDTVYVNGQQVGSNRNTTISNPTITGYYGNTATTFIGRDETAAYYNGRLGLFRFYNKLLSQSEINQNYYQAPIVTNGLVFAADAGNLVSYESGSTLTYSLTGSISGSLINGTGYSNINGGTWNFDGIDDYITLGTQTLVTNDFSISIWFNSTSNVTKEHFLFSLGYSLSNSFLLTQDTQNNGQSVLTAYYSVNGAVTGRSIATSTYPNTSIINICFVRQNGVNTPYINGVLQTDRIFTENVTLGSSTYVLGWAIPRNKASAYMQGNIYNFQMYNRALTTAEVSQNYNAQRSRFGL